MSLVFSFAQIGFFFFFFPDPRVLFTALYGVFFILILILLYIPVSSIGFVFNVVPEETYAVQIPFSLRVAPISFRFCSLFILQLYQKLLTLCVKS